MKVAGCRLRVGRPLHVARGTTMCRKERTGVCARTGDLARPLKQHKFYYVVLHSAEARARLKSPLEGQRPGARRRGRGRAGAIDGL